MKMKIKKLYPKAIIPTYGNPGDAGMDLYACIGNWEFVTLKPGESRLFTIGVAMEIPTGYVGIIKPRSGLAAKNQIDVLAGVIDSGYRGEIFVNLINHGEKEYTIDNGVRIAQMLLLPVYQAEFVELDELTESARGKDGHGSTGL